MHALLKIKVPVVVHEGVACNGCSVSPIEGVRYQCQVCDNYDLCERCEAKNEHPVTHTLLKAKQPLTSARKQRQKRQQKENKNKNKIEVIEEKKIEYKGPFAKELKEIRGMGFTSQSTEILVSLFSSAAKEKQGKINLVDWVVNKLIKN